MKEKNFDKKKGAAGENRREREREGEREMERETKGKRE